MTTVHVGWSLALALSSGVVGHLFFPASACAANELSSCDIRAALELTQRRLTSVRVSYVTTDAGRPSSVKGAYFYVSVIMCGPSSLQMITAHGHDALPWQDDPMRQASYVNGDRGWTTWPFDRTFTTYALSPTEAFPGSLESAHYLIATGAWPACDRRPPDIDGVVMSLRAVAMDPGYDSLRPNRDEVDGRPCCVLEKVGRDSLWLDMSRGCALMARELRSLHNGRLIMRISLSRHAEVAPGIWLPRVVDVERHDPDGKFSAVVTSRMRTIDLTCNSEDCAESMAFTPPPGSLEVSVGAHSTVRQSVPGGLEYIDDIVRWMRRRSLIGPVEMSATGITIATCAVVVVAGVAIMELWLLRERRRTATQ